MKKQIKCRVEFGSMFRQPKWLGEIRINNFSSTEEKRNKQFLDKIWKLIEEYNNR